MARFLHFWALCCLFSIIQAEDDYYEILGLASQRDDASEKEIKVAWRRLSKQHHPDLVGEASRSRYQQIQRAYEVLGDRLKRKVYDLRGEAGLKQYEGTARDGPQNPIEAMFGFSSGGGGPRRTANKNFIVLVSLEDLYNGGEHTLRYAQRKTCRHCRGSGAEPGSALKTCGKCRGRGHVRQAVNVMPGLQMEQDAPCPVCRGSGKQAVTKCSICGGALLIQGKHSLTFPVEIGTPSHHQLVFEMEADHGIDNLPGDVTLTIVAAPHPIFERLSNNNLRMQLSLTLKEALLGFHRVVKHLDGHEVDVEEMGVTQPSQESILDGEGMPIFNLPSEKGSLFVRYSIQLPTKLTADQEDVIRRLF